MQYRDLTMFILQFQCWYICIFSWYDVFLGFHVREHVSKLLRISFGCLFHGPPFHPPPSPESAIHQEFQVDIPVTWSKWRSGFTGCFNLSWNVHWWCSPNLGRLQCLQDMIEKLLKQEDFQITSIWLSMVVISSPILWMVVGTPGYIYIYRHVDILVRWIFVVHKLSCHRWLSTNLRLLRLEDSLRGNSKTVIWTLKVASKSGHFGWLVCFLGNVWAIGDPVMYFLCAGQIWYL